MTRKESEKMMNLRNLLILMAGCLMFAGCSGETVPETVEVSGTIKLKGRPLEGIRVKFMPNGLAGNANARTSIGETDRFGEYSLTYQLQGEEFPGAAIGLHKVVLEDTQVNASRTMDADRLKLCRIATKYSNSSTTSLEANVQPGDPAEFDFEVN